MVSPAAFVEYFTRRVFPKKNNDILDRVSTLQFEITNNCNLNCSICWKALREQGVPVKSISFDKFRIIMDKMLSIFPIREVNTQGLGEPMLCPDVLEILDCVKSKGLTAWFVTNGTLIDGRIAKKLVEIGVDKIRFSLDSADSEVYAAIKCGSSLEKIVQNIEKINHYKSQLHKKVPALAFNSVVLRKNFPTIGKLIELGRTVQAQEITLIPLVNFEKGLAVAQEQVSFYNDSFNAKFDALKKEAAADGIDLNLGISLESKETRFCNLGFYIDADCCVHPCCSISLFNFGNIYKQDVRVIVRNYLRFRKWLDGKVMSCKECNRILDKR